MPSVIDIGTFISCSPEISGRPMIAGTKTSVRRIVALYKQSVSAEEIARRISHLNLAQVYAALAYYHTNKEQIEEDLRDENAEYKSLSALHRSRS